jgi:hypothetical protein
VLIIDNVQFLIEPRQLFTPGQITFDHSLWRLRSIGLASHRYGRLEIIRFPRRNIINFETRL